MASITYKGFVIESTSRPRGTPPSWTLEVQITPADRRTGTRRCRASNTYATEEESAPRCLAFGRRIVDGELHPRPKGRRRS